MVTISDKNKILTLINTFTVAPERADELAKMLIEITDSTMQFLPGFISANIHVSLDKKFVTNYAQWESLEAFHAMLANPKAKPHMAQAAAIAEKFEPVLYNVRSAQGKITMADR